MTKINDLGRQHIAIKDIIESNIWTPGDFVPTDPDDICISKYGYHDCELSFPERWNKTIERCRAQSNYSTLRHAIESNGFLAPLGARIGHNNKHIVLIDGHTRLSAALELDFTHLEVYVSHRDTHRVDLTAGDSGWWKQGVDSPWLNV